MRRSWSTLVCSVGRRIQADVSIISAYLHGHQEGRAASSLACTEGTMAAVASGNNALLMGYQAKNSSEGKWLTCCSAPLARLGSLHHRRCSEFGQTKPSVALKLPLLGAGSWTRSPFLVHIFRKEKKTTYH